MPKKASLFYCCDCLSSINQGEPCAMLPASWHLDQTFVVMRELREGAPKGEVMDRLMRSVRRSFLAACLLASATSAAAALVPWVGGKLVYDSDRDITWVADANLCLTLDNCVNGDAAGGMLWNEAKQWAADLNYLGYRDWRLPTALDLDGSGPCMTFNCTGSEMGHLYHYELGGVSGVDGTSLVGTQGPFINIQSLRYWSSTPFTAGDPPVLIGAWAFGFDGGAQNFEAFGGTDDNLIAWAVRDGRPRGLPEPSNLALLSLGLAGLVVTRLRKRQAKPHRLSRDLPKACGDRSYT